MDKKFSIVINEQNGIYVVLLNCWQVVNGARVNIAEAVYSCAEFTAAQVKVDEFYLQYNN